MRFESRTALTLIRLQQAKDDEKIVHIRAELEAICLHLKARREEKYSPDQPRDEVGRWTSGGGGAEQNTGEETSTTGEAFGTAPDGTPVGPAGGIPNDKLNWTTRQFMSQFCKRSANTELPRQLENMSIKDVLALAKTGDWDARKCKKLLERDEYRK